MPNPNIQFRAPESFARVLDERAAYFVGGRSEVIKTDLSRYRNLIRAAQARIASEEIFSPDEQALIIDALNGVLLGEHPQLLSANVADAMSLDGLAVKWEVEEHAMREKLASLTPLESAALADAAETFWAAVARGEDKEPRGGLFGRGVG